MSSRFCRGAGWPPRIPRADAGGAGAADCVLGAGEPPRWSSRCASGGRPPRAGDPRRSAAGRPHGTSAAARRSLPAARGPTRGCTPRLRENPERRGSAAPRAGGRVRLAADRIQRQLARPRDRAVQRLMAHDRPDPPARGRPAAVLVEFLKHDDPTLLERVVRDVVVAGHAPGERQEAARAAPDPLLKVALQQGTPDCVPERGTRRRVAWSGHGSDRFCTFLAAASMPLHPRGGGPV